MHFCGLNGNRDRVSSNQLRTKSAYVSSVCIYSFCLIPLFNAVGLCSLSDDASPVVFFCEVCPPCLEQVVWGIFFVVISYTCTSIILFPLFVINAFSLFFSRVCCICACLTCIWVYLTGLDSIPVKPFFDRRKLCPKGMHWPANDYRYSCLACCFFTVSNVNQKRDIGHSITGNSIEV